MRNSVPRSMVVFAGVLMVLPLAVYAAAPNDAQHLTALKQIRQQFIEGGMYSLQQERACVQAAPNIDALNACDHASRQMMERMLEQQNADAEKMNAGSQQVMDSKK